METVHYCTPDCTAVKSHVHSIPFALSSTGCPPLQPIHPGSTELTKMHPTEIATEPIATIT
ncbi:MAG TPA: hypothetical protein VE089_04865 [Nitrososphaeraceae archaeon]|nr:hypothetical protein [Nitrososphaeraceae archaeon]